MSSKVTGDAFLEGETEVDRDPLPADDFPGSSHRALAFNVFERLDCLV